MKLFASLPAPTTEGTPFMIMAPMFSELGRGTYLSSMVKAAGLRRLCGITLFGNGSRKICGLVRLIGLLGSYSGFGRELNGLKMLTPASLKSPTADCKHTSRRS